MIQDVRELLAPFDIKDFKDKYWRRLPLQVKGDTAKVEGLFDVGQFFHYAGHPDVDLYAGKVFDEAKFHQIPINSQQAERLFSLGFTIQIEDLHWAAPGLLETGNKVRSELGIYSAMEAAAFLAKPGVGFGLHIDPQPDIFSIQISGTKRWTYSPEPVTRNPLVQTVLPAQGQPKGDPWDDFKRPPMSELVQAVQEPGDIFYFPAGVWHMTETLGSEPSCHVVLSSTNETWADFFFEALRPMLLDHPDWRDINNTTAIGAPTMQSTLQTRLTELKSILADMSVADLEKALQTGSNNRTRGAYRESYRQAQAHFGRPDQRQ